MQLILEQNGNRSVLAQEEFKKGGMIGYLPPLARTITSLIYFSDYSKQEFEPVLDERMYVYSYACINPDSVPDGFIHSEAYQVFLSRFLYVDLDGPTYRYDADFTRSLLAQQLYRRWAHQGTYYGFSSYSSITSTVGAFERDGHTLHEGFLIHRMFRTRYYLMQIISLFYRATLLDFAERTALVSKRIFRDWEDGKLTKGNVRMASDLRAEFLHFSNYWYFDELANKDEEFEHFTLQCRALRIEPVKKEVEEEVEKLNTLLQSYAASRNTEAVNRLAMLSLFVGAGAVLTGFFGMNFGRTFGRLFFEPDASTLGYHYAAVAVITVPGAGGHCLRAVRRHQQLERLPGRLPASRTLASRRTGGEQPQTRPVAMERRRRVIRAAADHCERRLSRSRCRSDDPGCGNTTCRRPAPGLPGCVPPAG